MRHVQRGHPDSLQDGAQFIHQLLAQRPVQRAERLIQHQQLRPRGQAARERHALLLAARQLDHAASFVAIQGDQRQHLLHTAGNLGLRQSLHAQPERDVGRDVLVREERIVLEHEAEVAPVYGDVVHVPACEGHGPGVGRLQTGHDAQQGGLAASARPEQADDLARLDRERGFFEHREPRVGLGYGGDSEQWRHQA